jgi:hypothetical protein
MQEVGYERNPGLEKSIRPCNNFFGQNALRLAEIWGENGKELLFVLEGRLSGH